MEEIGGVKETTVTPEGHEQILLVLRVDTLQTGGQVKIKRDILDKEYAGQGLAQ